MKKITKVILGIIIVISIIVIATIIQRKIDDKQYENNEKEALSKISIKVPKKFEDNSYSDLKNYYYYDKNASCSFSIETFSNTYKTYDDGKEYLENNIYKTLKDKVSEIEEVKINNYKWYHVTIEKEDSISYYYATTKEDRVYELEYNIHDYTKGEVKNNYCAQQKDEIFATVKLK